jgi:hypothetical protein
MPARVAVYLLRVHQAADAAGISSSRAGAIMAAAASRGVDRGVAPAQARVMMRDRKQAAGSRQQAAALTLSPIGDS